ncbi:MAG: hypothetical protein EOP49_50655 [Sphingobacteriales bacterium]|nr:MAG: hypothetical protein EOP49_50655 [Sphingobacteriales bacterium]
MKTETSPLKKQRLSLIRGRASLLGKAIGKQLAAPLPWKCFIAMNYRMLPNVVQPKIALRSVKELR